ncbi:MAG: DNA repair protein RadC [Burkholderiales bacterium]|nr:DNA repair protein RadC [Burkholderiales bacterium]
MSIQDWPEDQRPRERLIKNGAQTLSDPELLAIFLRTGLPGKNAIELGRELIQHYGSVAQLFASNFERFSKLHGMGPAKYAQLQAAFELSRRALLNDLSEGVMLNSPHIVKQYLQLELAQQSAEVFVCLFLDTQHRLICSKQLFSGTLRHANVYPREVVRAALDHNAAAIIFAHNHPCGSAEPSESDFSITRLLKSALDLIDVIVVDHIVVSRQSTHSFAEHGQL